MGLIDTTQINYWQQGQIPQASKLLNTIQHPSKITQHLSYDMFWMLSIFGGLLALDHLYLRSPLTFLMKLVINILGFGVWWLYDLTQATFNKDIVKVFGLGIPSLGPKGIGAGTLTSEKPDEKHSNFFIYSLALILGGLFGLDSFLLGNTTSGFIRLISLITGILAPVAIFWYIANLIKFFFRTDTLIKENWEYFGAPKPEDYKELLKRSLFEKIPILSSIIDILKKIFNKLFGIAKTAESEVTSTIKKAIDTAEAPIENLAQSAENTLQSVGSKIRNTLETPVTFAEKKIENLGTGLKTTLEAPVTFAEQKAEGILSKLGDSAKVLLAPVTGILGGITQPITTAAESVAESAKVTANALSTVATAGKEAVEGAVKIGEETAETLQGLTALSSGISNTYASALAPTSQKGGADSGFLPLILIGVISTIVVSGFVITYRRFRQRKNETSKTDSPPNPRAIRSPNQ